MSMAPSGGSQHTSGIDLVLVEKGGEGAPSRFRYDTPTEDLGDDAGTLGTAATPRYTERARRTWR